VVTNSSVSNNSGSVSDVSGGLNIRRYLADPGDDGVWSWRNTSNPMCWDDSLVFFCRFQVGREFARGAPPSALGLSAWAWTREFQPHPTSSAATSRALPLPSSSHKQTWNSVYGASAP
jgi:hypothetical protein